MDDPSRFFSNKLAGDSQVARLKTRQTIIPDDAIQRVSLVTNDKAHFNNHRRLACEQCSLPGTGIPVYLTRRRRQSAHQRVGAGS